MIKITDENRADYIASCLMETAEIMTEGGIAFKGGQLVSKIDQNKLNNLPPEEREKAKDEYRKAVQSTAAGIRQGEENKRLAKEKEEYERKKAEEDKKRAEVAEKYDRILKNQEERRKEMNKRFGRPINESVEILEEGAKFSLIPKFKKLTEKYPDLQTAKGLISETESVVNESSTEMTKTTGLNIVNVILTVIKYIYSISSVLLIPFCILIAPIVTYLGNRLVVWASEFGIHKSEIAKLKSAISDLKKVRDKSDDDKVKDKCNELIRKIQETIDKLDNVSKKSDNDKNNKVKEAMGESVESHLGFADTLLRVIDD